MTGFLPEAGTRNEVSGTVNSAVQGRDFHDTSIHFHSAELQTAVPRQLPRDITHFTGRQRDMISLDTLISSAASDGAGTVIVSAIMGTAGIGKTALAVHWAHGVRDHFPDGTLYVNLQGYGPGPPLSPSRVLEDFLRAMGVPSDRIPREPEIQAATFRTLLDQRRVLIILDNANSAEQVRPLLPGSQGCLVVITSRSLLPGLVARDGAIRIALDALSPEEAVVLLGMIVGVTRVAAEPESADCIARSCAYLPLALRIAAEQAVIHPQRPLAALAQALADESSRLDIIATSDDTTALRSVFSWSYNALRPELGRAFRLLGLHAGPDISLEAAAALIDATPATARILLDSLAAVHLIEEPADGRYRFHDLLRVYARERAVVDEPAAARAEAVERVLLLYLHIATATRSALSRGRPQSPFALPVKFGIPPSPVRNFTTQAEALRWCDVEMGNLVASVQQAADHGRQDIACWLPVALQPYFQRRTPFGPWLGTHIIGLAAAQAVDDPHAEAELYRGIGGAYYYQGRYDESFEHQRQALDRYRRFGWEGEILLVNLGSVCAALHRYDESIDYLLNALATARQTGYRNAEGFALQSLGATYQRLEKFEESVSYCRQAASIFGETGDRYGLGIALSRLSYAYLRLRKLPDAIDYLQQALGIARDIDDLPRKAWVLEALGNVAYEASSKDKAHENWHSALAIYERLMDHNSVIRMQAQLANPDIPPAAPQQP